MLTMSFDFCGRMSTLLESSVLGGKLHHRGPHRSRSSNRVVSARAQRRRRPELAPMPIFEAEYILPRRTRVPVTKLQHTATTHCDEKVIFLGIKIPFRRWRRRTSPVTKLRHAATKTYLFLGQRFQFGYSDEKTGGECRAQVTAVFRSI